MVVEPKNAVTCILLRGEEEYEILLARRNPSLRFMGGHHVVPGGRIDRDDRANEVVGAADEDHAKAIYAVVREVFEETGLLCAQGPLPSEDIALRARQSLLAGELSFGEILSRFSLAIDANQFTLAGYWVTPESSPIRFATRYFLHHVRNDQQEFLIEGEIIGLDWFRPAEARRLWHRGVIRLPSPVAYSLQQLATGPLAEAVRRLARGPQHTGKEHNRFEIRHGITVVPLQTRTIPPATHTNCVIVGEHALLVIDPGAEEASELEHLARQLDHLIELGATVEAVLLTHSHRDHTDGVGYIRDKYDVPVCAHRAVEPQVDFAIDRYLSEDEVLISKGDPQWRLRAIHTPGHDPGHLCFLEESTRVLLAGDMMANPGTIVVSHDFGGNMAHFMTSLERLLEVDCQLIVPSHGHPMGDPPQAIGGHLEHRRWRERKIKAAYDSGVRTFSELLARAYDDAPEAALPLARHSLEAHLAKLGVDVER